jgi:hypothetical protein
MAGTGYPGGYSGQSSHHRFWVRSSLLLPYGGLPRACFGPASAFRRGELKEDRISSVRNIYSFLGDLDATDALGMYGTQVTPALELDGRMTGTCDAGSHCL